jgi:hypothetical protein
LNHGTASFADKNVSTGKTVTVVNYSLADGNDGGLASNYDLSSTTASTTASISQLASVEWTGSGDGTNWFDPANWAGGAVPDLTNVAAVVIPEAKGAVTINFNDDNRTGLAEAGTVDVTSVTGSLATLGLKDNTGHDSRLNATTLDLKQLTIADKATLGLTGSANSLTTADGLNIAAGTLIFADGSANTITSTGGGISITPSLTLSGGSLNLSANGDITLNNAANAFSGTVSVTQGVNANLRNTSALKLGEVAVSGNLTAEAAGGDLAINGNITKTSGADATP